MTRPTVLVIDDEKDVRHLLRVTFEKHGYDVVAAEDGESGLRAAAAAPPDAVLLDVMMPGIDGLEVCRRLRSDPRTARLPVLLLTAKAEEADRVVGLELGADDYVVKPFSPRELVARVKALLRRAAGPAGDGDVLRRGGLVVDVGRRSVAWKGRAVELTATEFRILEHLARRPGRVLSRSEIIDEALGRDEAITDRSIDVHVTALRRKLGAGGELLETVRGFGYRFRAE